MDQTTDKQAKESKRWTARKKSGDTKETTESKRETWSGEKGKEMRAGLGNVGVIRRDMGRLLPVYLQPLPSAQGREKKDKAMK